MTMKDDTIRVRISAKGKDLAALELEAKTRAVRLESDRYRLFRLDMRGAIDEVTDDFPTHSNPGGQIVLYLEAQYEAIYVPREG